jgi:SAM-dependent methyltransferase
VALLCRSFGIDAESLRGKQLLEVGSGFGIFVAVTRRDYGMDSCGLEPDASGFENSYAISRSIMSEYGLNPEVIVAARGETIPFPDSHFDFVFSSTALEHTDSPERVLNESVRVLKPGGCLQFVFPNYGSVFEGHYAIPWIPHLPHWLARFWVRLWGRDPSFVDTLQFTNYFRTRRWLRQRDDVDVLTLGEAIFSERMRTFGIKDWGGLGRVRRWLAIAHRLRLVEATISVCLHLRAFDPIILTLRRKSNPRPPTRADNRGMN